MNEWYQRGVSRVPCEFWDGTIAGAVLEARRRNSETKLVMTTTQKLDDAWKLVKMTRTVGEKTEYHFSKAEIVAASDVAKGTVGNMRKALETIGRDTARAISVWDEARKLASGKGGVGTMTADEVEERKRQMIEDWVGRLRRAFGQRFGKDSELAADVLHRYLGTSGRTEAVGLDIARCGWRERRVFRVQRRLRESQRTGLLRVSTVDRWKPFGRVGSPFPMSGMWTSN
jgi:hypothetical protein